MTNRTTGEPAAGDTVTLIRLSQGMQEAGSTRTDAKGRFTLDVPDEGIHLVRVTHDKANYFQAVEPNAQTVDVDVYTAAAKVEGLVSEAEVMRVQSDAGGGALDVVANFFVRNLSSPPKTQFSDRPFEFYLPPGAEVEGSVALGPGKMAMQVKSPPVPLGDAPDHYAFIFPLRPCASKAEADADEHCGETRFQVSFRLPYSGSLAITPKVAMPTDTLAIMLPKSMAFKPAAGAPYSAAAEELSAQAFVARNVTPAEPLGFTVSGSGQMPRDAQTSGAAQGGDAAGQTQSATTDTRPGGGLGVPLDPGGTNDPWAKYKWWILGGLGLALAAGAGFMLKGAAAAPGAVPLSAAAGGAIPGSVGMLQVLKDELFTLETERLEGRLSETQYAEQKSALEVVLRRALARGAGSSGAADGIDAAPGASNL